MIIYFKNIINKFSKKYKCDTNEIYKLDYSSEKINLIKKYLQNYVNDNIF
jgi:hypothetical protein